MLNTKLYVMMKKLILVLATALLSAGIMSAQDLAQATELYNNGANALTTGDKVSALEYFQKAYEMGKTIGEEADELVKNCKQAIPTVMLSIAKELSNNQEYDKALEQIQAAITVAKDFAVSEVEEEATSLLPQIELMKDMDAANDAFNAKDLTGAAALYNKVLEADPSNGPASIRLVQCLANAGKIDEAKAAYDKLTDAQKELVTNKDVLLEWPGRECQEGDWRRAAEGCGQRSERKEVRRGFGKRCSGERLYGKCPGFPGGRSGFPAAEEERRRHQVL